MAGSAEKRAVWNSLVVGARDVEPLREGGRSRRGDGRLRLGALASTAHRREDPRLVERRMSRIRLDDLVGTRVRDEEGRVVGRIFEMRAEARGKDLVIVEYHLGAHALLERIGLSALRLVGLRSRELRRVAWDQMDVSDPGRPVLRRGG